MGSVCLLRGRKVIKKLFQPQPNLTYPLMRDPARQPKCYELTDQERAEAVLRTEQLLKERDREQSHGYYGA
jgi:hypothetical protein